MADKIESPTLDKALFGLNEDGWPGQNSSFRRRIDELLSTGVPIQAPHGNYQTCGGHEQYQAFTRAGETVLVKSDAPGIYFIAADDGAMTRVGDILDTDSVVEHVRRHFTGSRELFKQWCAFLGSLAPEEGEEDTEDAPGVYGPPEDFYSSPHNAQN